MPRPHIGSPHRNDRVAEVADVALGNAAAAMLRYPLMQTSGSSRATQRASPALSAACTTAVTSL